jgi:hypothetical protein
MIGIPAIIILQIAVIILFLAVTRNGA